MSLEKIVFLRELTAEENVLWCPFAYEKLKQLGDIANNIARQIYNFILSNDKSTGSVTNELAKIILHSVNSVLHVDKDVLGFIKVHHLPIQYESPLFAVCTCNNNNQSVQSVQSVPSVQSEQSVQSVQSSNCNGSSSADVDEIKRKRLKLSLKKKQDDSPMTSDSPDVANSDLEDLEMLLRQDEQNQVSIKQEPIEIKQEVEDEPDMGISDASTVIYEDNTLLQQEQRTSLLDENVETPPSSQGSYVFNMDDFYKRGDGVDEDPERPPSSQGSFVFNVGDYYKKTDEVGPGREPLALSIKQDHDYEMESTPGPSGTQRNNCDNRTQLAALPMEAQPRRVLEEADKVDNTNREDVYEQATQRISYPINLQEGNLCDFHQFGIKRKKYSGQSGVVDVQEDIDQCNALTQKFSSASGTSGSTEVANRRPEIASGAVAGPSKAGSVQAQDEEALLMGGSDSGSANTDDAERLLNSEEDASRDTSESGESHVGLDDIIKHCPTGKHKSKQREDKSKDAFMNAIRLIDKDKKDEIDNFYFKKPHITDCIGLQSTNKEDHSHDVSNEERPRKSQRENVGIQEELGSLLTVSKVEYCDALVPTKKTLAADDVLDRLMNCSSNYADLDNEIKGGGDMSSSSSDEEDVDSEKENGSADDRDSFVSLEDLSLDSDDLERFVSDKAAAMSSRDRTRKDESDYEVIDDTERGVLHSSRENGLADEGSSSGSTSESEGTKASKRDKEFPSKQCAVIIKKIKNSVVNEKLKNQRRESRESRERLSRERSKSPREKSKSPKERSKSPEVDVDRLCDLSTLDNPRRRKQSKSGSDSDRPPTKRKPKLSLKKSPKKKMEKDSVFSSADSNMSDDMFVESPTPPPAFKSDNESDSEPANPKELLAEILCKKMSDKETDISSTSSSEDEEEGKHKKKKKKKEKEKKTEHKKKFLEKFTLTPKKDKYAQWRNDPLLKQRFGSDSDSDRRTSKVKRKKNKNKKKMKKKGLSVLNDSDFTDIASKHSDSFSSDTSADIELDFSKKRKKRSDSNSEISGSSSDSNKPKRKFSAKKSDSSGDEFVSSIYRTPKKNGDKSCDDPSTPGSSKMGRKNIRKVIDDKDLAEATQVARHEEEERITRLEEKARVISQITSSQESPSKTVVLDVDESTQEAVVCVDSWLSKLMKPHQIEGVKFLWEACFESVEKFNTTKGSGCILAHCMGLGKTFQVIVLIHTLFSQRQMNMNHVLIVCPLSTVKNWHNEFNQWLKKAKYPGNFSVLSLIDKRVDRLEIIRKWRHTRGVLILGYEAYEVLTNELKTLPHSPKKREKILEALVDPGPELVVCDEGHLLKNGKTLRTQALMNIKTLRRIVLTGTPLQNNLKEYYYMVQFVKPNLLGTYKEYQNAFVSPIENGQYEDSSKMDILLMKKRIHILHKLLKKTIQRVEVSELKTHLDQIWDYVIFVQLSPLQIQLYKHFMEVIGTTLQRDSGTTPNKKQFLRDYQQLGLICSHPYLLHLRECQRKKRLKEYDTVADEPDLYQDLKGIPRKWYQSLCPLDIKNKLEYGHKYVVLQSIIEEAEALGDKVLIFSASVVELNALEHFFQELGTQRCRNWKRDLDYFRMDGTVLPSERSTMCDKFNNKYNTRARVFMMSHRVGGLGLNLVAANRVILMGVNFNPSYDTQSIYRAYRFGQTKPVYVYRLVAMGTMEEKLYQRCITKLAQAGRVVDKYQIDRHYSRNDVSVFYQMMPEYREDRPTPLLPADRLMANLIQKTKIIYQYHEHEALLENKPDEALTESEKNSAWEEYNNNRKLELDASKRPVGFIPGQQNPMQGVPTIQLNKPIPINGNNVKLVGYYPNGFPKFAIMGTSGHLPNGILQMPPEMQKQLVEQLLRDPTRGNGGIAGLSAGLSDLPARYADYLRELAKRQSTISWSRHSVTASSTFVVNRNNVPSSDDLIYLSGPSSLVGSTAPTHVVPDSASTVLESATSVTAEPSGTTMNEPFVLGEGTLKSQALPVNELGQIVLPSSMQPTASAAPISTTSTTQPTSNVQNVFKNMSVFHNGQPFTKGPTGQNMPQYQSTSMFNKPVYQNAPQYVSNNMPGPSGIGQQGTARPGFARNLFPELSNGPGSRPQYRYPPPGSKATGNANNALIQSDGKLGKPTTYRLARPLDAGYRPRQRMPFLGINATQVPPLRTPTQPTAIHRNTPQAMSSVQQNPNANSAISGSAFCLFCQSDVQHFEAHLAQMHKEEREVQNIFQLPVNSVQRWLDMQTLINRGLFIKNAELLFSSMRRNENEKNK